MVLVVILTRNGSEDGIELQLPLYREIMASLRGDRSVMADDSRIAAC